MAESEPDRQLAMKSPCPAALGAFGVPARRWSTRTDLYRQLEIARDLLETGDLRTVNVAAAADHAGLSMYHFLRLFTETYRTKPSRFLADRRVALAKRLLEEGNLAMFEIAEEVGYESAAAFTRFFRREAGVAPSDYRRRGSSDGVCGTVDNNR